MSLHGLDVWGREVVETDLHVHSSMPDAKGRNIFGKGGRKPLEAAVAGLLTAMPESLLLFINTWSGFRRITPGSYAPTRAVCAENNRSFEPGARKSCLSQASKANRFCQHPAVKGRCASWEKSSRGEHQ